MLKGLEDYLLVLLIVYRCHITQDFLACLYRVDKATKQLDIVLGVVRELQATQIQRKNWWPFGN